MSLKLDIITYVSSALRKMQMNYILAFWSTVKTTSWFQLVSSGTSHEYNCVSSFPLDSRWLFVVHSWQHKSIAYRNICHYGPRQLPWVQISAWVNNHKNCFLWDVITQPCLNFNGGLVTLFPVKVCTWMSICIQQRLNHALIILLI